VTDKSNSILQGTKKKRQQEERHKKTTRTNTYTNRRGLSLPNNAPPSPPFSHFCHPVRKGFQKEQLPAPSGERKKVPNGERKRLQTRVEVGKEFRWERTWEPGEGRVQKAGRLYVCPSKCLSICLLIYLSQFECLHRHEAKPAVFQRGRQRRFPRRTNLLSQTTTLTAILPECL